MLVIDTSKIPGTEFSQFADDFTRSSGVGADFSEPRLFKGAGKTWGVNAYDVERLDAEFGALVVPIFHEWSTGFQKKNTVERVRLSEHLYRSLHDPAAAGYLIGAIDDQGNGQPDPAWGAISRDGFLEARANRARMLAILAQNTQLRNVADGTTAIFLGGHSVTRMHQHQPAFLLQVFGTKKASLIAPHFAKFLYRENVSLYAENLIDFHDVDYDKYPLLRQVTIFDAVLERSDVLFIPDRWFHYVEALDFPSLSLSRFSTAKSKS